MRIQEHTIPLSPMHSSLPCFFLADFCLPVLGEAQFFFFCRAVL
jgi:hypothetical protein